MVRLVGWVSPSRQIREGNAYQQTYDQNGYGGGQAELGIKARLIDLISAVRTLMRSTCHSCNARYLLNQSTVPLIAINTLVILYELVIP
jgi:immediate early response 3-interacting protein 1